MKKYIILLLFSISFLSCNKEYKVRNFNNVTLKTDSVPFNIRAVEITDKVVHFTTSKGRTISYIHNSDNFFDSSKNYFDTIQPNIRATAYNGKSFFALSIESPALLFKNDVDAEGKISNPTLVYRENDSLAFYDSMKFFDEKHGIAMGDPTENCISVILTKDGGNTWCKVGCDDLPNAAKGEAAFAASNTNIAIVNNNAWIATGGIKSRVFHTTDKGTSWKVYNTPMIQGSPTTGAYSIDFYDEKNGIIAGGDYTNKKGNIGNKAITKNGGKTWELISEGTTPGYISCVQYVPNTEGKEVFAVSTEGIYFSNDKGNTWKQVHKQGFYTIRFKDKNTAWLAGNKTIAKLTLN